MPGATLCVRAGARAWRGGLHAYVHSSRRRAGRWGARVRMCVLRGARQRQAALRPECALRGGRAGSERTAPRAAGRAAPRRSAAPASDSCPGRPGRCRPAHAAPSPRPAPPSARRRQWRRRWRRAALWWSGAAPPCGARSRAPPRATWSLPPTAPACLPRPGPPRRGPPGTQHAAPRRPCRPGQHGATAELRRCVCVWQVGAHTSPGREAGGAGGASGRAHGCPAAGWNTAGGGTHRHGQQGSCRGLLELLELAQELLSAVLELGLLELQLAGFLLAGRLARPLLCAQRLQPQLRGLREQGRRRVH